MGAGRRVHSQNRHMLRRTARAVLLRCPNCGASGVVRRLTLVERCSRCGHRFERHEGYWIGAVALNTVATIGLFGVVLVAGTVLMWPEVNWGALTVAVVAISALFPIAFYPWSKLLWVAFELSMHPVED
jgi:uncharacterized protein (DUF983 family)